MVDFPVVKLGDVTWREIMSGFIIFFGAIETVNWALKKLGLDLSPSLPLGLAFIAGGAILQYYGF